MYSFTAGTWLANSNGTPVMRTYTLLPAPPFCAFHFAKAAVYWFGSVTHAFGANPTCFAALRKFSKFGSGEPTHTTACAPHVFRLLASGFQSDSPSMS